MSEITITVDDENFETLALTVGRMDNYKLTYTGNSVYKFEEKQDE